MFYPKGFEQTLNHFLISITEDVRGDFLLQQNDLHILPKGLLEFQKSRTLPAQIALFLGIK